MSGMDLVHDPSDGLAVGPAHLKDLRILKVLTLGLGGNRLAQKKRDNGEQHYETGRCGIPDHSISDHAENLAKDVELIQTMEAAYGNQDRPDLTWIYKCIYLKNGGRDYGRRQGTTREVG